MFKKRDGLRETELALCIDPSQCPKDPDDEETPKPPPLSPYCEENPEACKEVVEIFDPKDPKDTKDPKDPKKCPPGSTDKACQKKTPTPPIPPHLPGSFVGGSPNFKTYSHPHPQTETGYPKIPNMAGRLGEIFEPKGGWPNGENPFLKGEGFDYDKLSPSQKKKAQKVMKGINKRNKAFLAKHGFAGSGSGAGNSLSDEVSGMGVSADANPKKTALNSSFAGGESSRSTDSTGLSALGPPKKRKNSIADQMKAMLNKMYGDAGGSGKGSLAGKSIQVGLDQVGVREDNIFMMVHRCHRKLDEQENHFIKEAF